MSETQAVDKRREIFASTNSVFLMFCGTILILAAFGALPLSDFIRSSTGAVAGAVVAGILLALAMLQSHMLRLDERHGSAVLLGFLPPLLGWIGGVSALIAVDSIQGFFIGMAAGVAGGVLCLALIGMVESGVSVHKARVARVLRIVPPFFVVVLLLWVNGYGNTFFVEAIFVSSEVARFAFAYTIASILQLVATSMNQVWAPRFMTQVRTVGEEQIAHSSRIFFAAEGAVLGLAGAVILVLYPLLIPWAGDSLEAYDNLSLPLYFLFVAYVCAIPWYHVQNYYYVYKKGTRLLRLTLLSSVIGTVLWIAAMLVLGTPGIYAGFAILMTVKSIAAVRFGREIWRFPVVWEGAAAGIVLLTVGWLAGRLL